ncbi:hypothetical protein WA026_006110 [Henosepilachna vigintioctopunctata]|uniref:Uncharacterized protein n=1 Tax=Henosepilachna vigintioctopunctata TaxID=420089 RepID=A0AAW1TMX3_9CUCU
MTIVPSCDGILEEYSDDEVDCTPTEKKAVVDYAALSWGPWTWYKLWSAGSTTFNYLDAAGEFLAAFLGITTPKYYFELEEYKKNTLASEVENAQNKGWSEPSYESKQDISFKNVQTTQPSMPDIV